MLNKMTKSFVALAAKSQKPGTLPMKGAGTTGTIIPDISKNLKNVPVPVVDGVNNVLTQMFDYLKLAETETTKRAEIFAKRDVALKTLQDQREVFEQLMTFTFQERAAVLQKQFDVLDHAMAGGELSAIKFALDGMVNVIQTSPFKSIQEMQTALGSKDFVVRLE